MAKMIINGEVYSGSTNYASAITYIKEDGTKSTVQKELDSRPANNNLLINSNFANPVNQRGLNTYNWMSQYGGYCIDRWRLSCKLDEDVTVTINDGYINFIQTGTGDGKFGYLEQKVEFPTKYSGKTLTFSMKYRVNSKSDKLKPIFLEDGKSTSYDVLICDGKWHTFSVKHTLGTITDWFSVAIWGEQKFDIDLEWAKLELGEVATPYVPRLYAEELRLCKRYYQKIYIGVPITQISTDSLQAIVSIPCEEMSLDKPRVDATNLRISANSVGQGDIILSNCAIITSQCKFYIQFYKASHGLTVSNNLSVQGLLIIDAEL